MDGFMLNRLIKTVDGAINGKMISDISFLGRSVRLAAGRASLTFHLGGDVTWIEFSSDNAPLEGVRLTPFMRFMKKSLSRSRIVSVNTPGGDRVVELVLEKLNPLGLESFVLVFEMIDGAVNAFVIKDGIIQQVLKPAAGARALEAGDLYVAPPTPFPSVFDTPVPGSGDIRFVNTDSHLEEYLMSVREKNGRDEAQRLLDEMVDAEVFYVCSRRGKTIIAPICYPGWEEAGRFEGVVNAVNGYYGTWMGNRAVEAARARVLEYITQKKKRTLRTLENIRGDFKKHSEYAVYKQKGDLLLTYGRLVGKYDDEVMLTDPVTDEKVKIALDPSLSPSDNAARYYKKYTRGKRALEAVERRRAEIESALEYLEQTEFFTGRTETLDDIRALGRELGMPSYTKKETVRKKGDAVKTPSFKSGDCIIYYGRSARENEYVSLKIASRNDSWLHVRNMTGTHVVIRCPNDSEPDDDTVEAAAQLAVYMSKARGGSKVPVDITKAKYVKKPKGTPPGFVLYDNFSTVIVDQDYAVVERLTGRRAERK